MGLHASKVRARKLKQAGKKKKKSIEVKA